MTVSSTNVSDQYTGDGATTVFAVTFQFFGEDEIEVVERTIASGAEVVKTLGTDYTVQGGAGATGSVTASVAPPATVEWHIRRKTKLTQEIDYIEHDQFPSASHEGALDRDAMRAQERDEALGRALKLPKTSGLANIDVPEPVAKKALKWDDAGAKLVNTAEDIDDAAGQAAESAAAAATSETNAATSETNAATSETNAATSETNAAASAAKLKGSSTSSVLIGTGAKTFETQSGKFFEAGRWLLVTSDADPTNYMHGQVTSYAGTTLTLNMTNVGGSGTFADWTITVAGTRGAVGATGPTGPQGPAGPVDVSGVPAAGQLVEWVDADTIKGIADPLAVAKGGTGGATAAAARTNLGLGDVAVENAPLAAGKGGTGLGAPADPGDDGKVLTAQAGAYVLGAAAGVKVLDKVAADVSVGNTTTETSIYSFSVPGGTLSTNNALRLTLQWKAKQHVAGTGTITLRLKYGATTIASLSTRDPDSTSFRLSSLSAILAGDGGPSAQRGTLITPKTNANDANFGVAAGTAAEDSTGVLTLDVTAQWSAAGGANQELVMEYAILEELS